MNKRNDFQDENLKTHSGSQKSTRAKSKSKPKSKPKSQSGNRAQKKTRKPKQSSLFRSTRKNTKRWWIENQKVYGGALNYRKCARPFDSKMLTHTVVTAHLGHCIWFTRSQKSIGELLKKSASRYGVRIKSFSIQKDHIHILNWVAQAKGRAAQLHFQNFLRYFTAEMGRKYKMIFKNFGIKKTQSIWVNRPFTRLVSWGKKFIEQVVRYIQKNTDELLGNIEYTERDHKLNLFLKRWRYATQNSS